MEPRRDPLKALLDRLRTVGLDRDPVRIADALWLARYARSHADPDPAEDGRDRPDEDPAGPRSGAAPSVGGLPGPEPDRSPAAPDHARMSLIPTSPDPARRADEQPAEHLTDRDPTDGRHSPAAPLGPTVNVPAAAALPEPLAVMRALRPLRNFTPSSPRRVWELDAEATAAATADSDELTLVRRLVRHRDTTLHLLMDASPSMVVWRQLLDDLRALCERLGAFRDVQVDYLHRGEDGELFVSAVPDPQHRPRGGSVLPDATGRRIGLLLSDCTGSLWRGGQAQRLLREWGRRAPVAVLQPLPQRLWGRSAFPAEACTLWRDPTEDGGFGCRTAATGRQGGSRQGAFPVPVLAPTAEALGGWARLVAGSAATPVRAAVGWVWDQELPPVAGTHVPGTPVPGTAVPGVPEAAPAPSEPTPEERVAGFRLTASPDAVRLAVHLAAAPLTVPVMHLVQRALLPRSGPADLAEVLLSGLMSRSPGPDPWRSEQWYQYLPGVRAVLLGPLAREEAILVLKYCSEYVTRRFGSQVRNFPALAVAQLENGVGAEESGPAVRLPEDPANRLPRPFAEVPALVVRRYLTPIGAAELIPAPGTDRLAAARALVLQYRADGRVHRLLDAVRILTRLQQETTETAGGVVAMELAEAQLLLWRLQGDPGLLREACRTARLAVERAAAEAARPWIGPERLNELARARRSYGQALHGRAHELMAEGRPAEATRDLELAAGQLLGAFGPDGAVHGLREGPDLELVLERAEVLRELWQLSGEGGALQSAAALLESLVTGTRLVGSGYARQRLLLGRTLLDLASVPGRAPSTEPSAAAQRLREGLEVPPEDGGVTGAERAGALIDLARAIGAAADGPPPNPADDEVLTLLAEAVGTAADDRPSAGRAWELIGRRLGERRDAGLEPEALDRAADAYEQARRLYREEHPEHARLLTERGRVLLRIAAEEGRARAAADAVLVLREALAETPRQDPASAERQLLVGQALGARHWFSADLADLREAEHTTERAVGGPWPRPVQEAEALLFLGDLRVSLHRLTRVARWLDQALDAYRKAASAARAAGGAGGTLLAARAGHRRGEVWEALDRPRAARQEYREALREWQRLADGGGDEAELTRQAADRLAR